MDLRVVEVIVIALRVHVAQVQEQEVVVQGVVVLPVQVQIMVHLEFQVGVAVKVVHLAHVMRVLAVVQEQVLQSKLEEEVVEVVHLLGQEIMEEEELV
jgi:hypothetical protein